MLRASIRGPKSRLSFCGWRKSFAPARHGVASSLALCGALVCACGDYEEAPRVEVPVLLDSSGIMTVMTDLGYEVELREARVMVQDLSFAIAGEAHAIHRNATRTRGVALLEKALDFVVAPAHAHPGHFQEGDITGELRGRFQLNWLSGAAREVGVATLIAGTYQSVNFPFAHGAQTDGMAADDPLIEHTALLLGQARRGEAAFDFVATVDSPEGRQLVGVPFAHTVAEEGEQSLRLRLLTRDPYEEDTLFDGIDFAALDPDADGNIEISATSSGSTLDAYFQLRRTFQTHDHFDVQATPTRSQ